MGTCMNLVDHYEVDNIGKMSCTSARRLHMESASVSMKYWLGQDDSRRSTFLFPDQKDGADLLFFWRNQGTDKALKDTSSTAKIMCSTQVRDSSLSTWLKIFCSQVLKLSSQLKTAHLPFQGAETTSKILKTLIVQPWIDKHSLRRWPVINILIANVSEVDPVLFRNTI